MLNAFALPEAVAVWERVGASFGQAPHPRVYLSVSAYRDGPGAKPVSASRTFSNQREVDELFRSRGFHVVAPETLSIEEQIHLVRGADVLAGWSGSALHLGAFAPASTRILELGDMRSGGSPVPQQQVISRRPAVRSTRSCRLVGCLMTPTLTTFPDSLRCLTILFRCWHTRPAMRRQSHRVKLSSRPHKGAP